MNHRLVEARYLRAYVLWLRFEDGLEGEVDLERDLDGGVFAPLRSPAVFRRFRLDPVLKTIVWPEGADFAPEFLRGKLRVDA